MAFLGIDVGTSGTKALLLNEDGQVVATAESPHTLLTPKPGWTEQHPEEWWQATILATRAVLKKAKREKGVGSAIGLSGQMHWPRSFSMLAERCCGSALLWNDQRTTTQCRQIEEKAGGRAALIQMVSNPALTGFTAPKILWLMQNEPRKFEKCRQVLLPKDYIRYRLTGEYATEVSDASGTLLLDVKQARTGMVELIGIHFGSESIPTCCRASSNHKKSPAR